jgi:hypothetical protein
MTRSHRASERNIVVVYVLTLGDSGGALVKRGGERELSYKSLPLIQSTYKIVKIPLIHVNTL